MRNLHRQVPGLLPVCTQGLCIGQLLTHIALPCQQVSLRRASLRETPSSSLCPTKRSARKTILKWRWPTGASCCAGCKKLHLSCAFWMLRSSRCCEHNLAKLPMPLFCAVQVVCWHGLVSCLPHALHLLRRCVLSGSSPVSHLTATHCKLSPAHGRCRPSHADATYDMKYGIRAVAGGGRASARETIGRVAAGAVAKKLLQHCFGTEVRRAV